MKPYVSLEQFKEQLAGEQEYNRKRDRDATALTVYNVCSAIRAGVEHIIRDRERDLADARQQLKRWKDALDALKAHKLPAQRDPDGQSCNFLRQSDLEAGVREALTRLRVCKASADRAVHALTEAKAAQQNAHTQLIHGNVQVVTVGRKSTEVIIRVGGKSVTRHLHRMADGESYRGMALDNRGIVEYPHLFSVVDPTLTVIENMERILERDSVLSSRAA